MLKEVSTLTPKEIVQSVLSLPEEKRLHGAKKAIATLISKIENEGLDQEEGCYYIAEFMFLPDKDTDKNLFAVIDLAGELELPDRHLSKKREELWQELLSYFHKF